VFICWRWAEGKAVQCGVHITTGTQM